MVTNMEVKLSPHECTETLVMSVACGWQLVTLQRSMQSRHHSLTPYMASERCEAVSRQSANIWHCPPWNTSATAQLSYQSHCSIQYIIACRSQFHWCTLLTINVHIQYIYIQYFAIESI